MTKKKFRTVWFCAPAGESDNEVSEGWFWNKKHKKVKTTEPRIANYDQLSQSIEDAHNELDVEGYDVTHIIPLNIGSSESQHPSYFQGSTVDLGDIGFSVTRGVIVVGKLRQTSDFHPKK